MSPCRGDYIFTDKQVVSVWRVVSEDSDHFGSRFAVVHRLSDFHDLKQSTYGEMCICFHQPHALYELQKIKSLGSSQRILLEEGDDCLEQIIPSCHAVLVQVLFVIVESTICVDLSYPKELLEHV